MPSKNPAPASSSTRLENLRFAPGRASVEIDGQPVEFSGEKAAPAIQAFQTFYQEAYRAYGTAPEAAAERRAEQAPWWRRLRGWLARWLGGAEERTSAARPDPGSRAGAAARPSSEPREEGDAATRPRATPQTEPRAVRAAAVSALAPAAPQVPPPPLLLAAFADEKGVHLFWNLTPGERKEQIRERSYGFDSPVASSLQQCYGKLAELGYEVVDLKAWQAAPAAKPAPETRERVMRLLPPDAEHPQRIALVPLETDLPPQILIDSAKKVAALHAAADPAVPPDKRLTFIGCTIGPQGDPKIVRYATGEDPTNEAAWKEIKAVWPEAEKTAKPPRSAPKPEARPVREAAAPELFPT